jgi:tRNA(adenine34) deaminase
MLDDAYFMREALKEAKEAENKDEVPVGAVIVYNNRIIARAHNQVETLKDTTAHAEMLAFTAATEFVGGKYLNDCVLYVTLEPCVMCAGAAYWTRIMKIVYAANDEKRGYSKIKENILHPKTEIIKGVLEKESKDLLKNFFQNKRKNN